MKIKVWMGITLASMILGGAFVINDLQGSTVLGADDPYEPMVNTAADDPYPPMSPTKS